MIMTPDDVSEILFGYCNDVRSSMNENELQAEIPKKLLEPLSNDLVEYIGPIEVVPVSSTYFSNKHKQMQQSGERCVIVTRDVTAGELLFIITPTLHADVNKVKSLWIEYHVDGSNCRNNSGSDYRRNIGNPVDRIAEQVLLESCIRCTNPSIIRSCKALKGATNSDYSLCSLDMFLFKKDQEQRQVGNDPPQMLAVNGIVENDWLQIIRRNAFGPDFITSEYINRRWNDEKKFPSGSTSAVMFQPDRILSLYPLAAMINHSCIPNAVRVYAKTRKGEECMIVHACSNITAGSEVCWSYIPVIEPYHVRYKSLKTRHGFVCSCERCMAEGQIWKTNEYLLKVSRTISKLLNSRDDRNPLEIVMPPEVIAAVCDTVSILENELLSSSTKLIASTNEVKRFLRVGFLQLYVWYLNSFGIEDDAETTSLQKRQGSNGKHTNSDAEQSDDSIAISRRKEMLSLCTQLHFSLAACHNASTEHLSVSLFNIRIQRIAFLILLCRGTDFPILSQ